MQLKILLLFGCISSSLIVSSKKISKEINAPNKNKADLFDYEPTKLKSTIKKLPTKISPNLDQYIENSKAHLNLRQQGPRRNQGPAKQKLALVPQQHSNHQQLAPNHYELPRQQYLANEKQSGRQSVQLPPSPQFLHPERNHQKNEVKINRHHENQRSNVFNRPPVQQYDQAVKKLDPVPRRHDPIQNRQGFDDEINFREFNHGPRHGIRHRPQGYIRPSRNFNNRREPYQRPGDLNNDGFRSYSASSSRPHDSYRNNPVRGGRGHKNDEPQKGCKLVEKEIKDLPENGKHGDKSFSSKKYMMVKECFFENADQYNGDKNNGKSESKSQYHTEPFEYSFEKDDFFKAFLSDGFQDNDKEFSTDHFLYEPFRFQN